MPTVNTSTARVRWPVSCRYGTQPITSHNEYRPAPPTTLCWWRTRQTVHVWTTVGDLDGWPGETPAYRLIHFLRRVFSMHYTRGSRPERHCSVAFGVTSLCSRAMKRGCRPSIASTSPAGTTATALNGVGRTVLSGFAEHVSVRHEF